jgi:sortase (surface protein transpeptidase)
MALVLTTHRELLQFHFPEVRIQLLGGRAVSLDTAVGVDATTSQTNFKKTFMLAVRFLLLAVIITAGIIIGSLVLPELTTRLSTDTQQDVLSDAQQHIAPEAVAANPTGTSAERPVDPTLPEGTWISIPKIGVNTQALALENSEAALEKGVWLVPEFGRPGDTTQPTIMAAHRYGWKWWWQNDYWKLHSFYLLTETQPGDLIEVITDQKKYVYEVYAADEGDHITDYSADLILYTCKFLNSPVRYFRYAKLLPQAY